MRCCTQKPGEAEWIGIFRVTPVPRADLWPLIFSRGTELSMSFLHGLPWMLSACLCLQVGWLSAAPGKSVYNLDCEGWSCLPSLKLSNFCAMWASQMHQDSPTARWRETLARSLISHLLYTSRASSKHPQWKVGDQALNEKGYVLYQPYSALPKV